MSACSLTVLLGLLFAGGEEKRYFAPMNDAQDGGPDEDQSFRDGGVVPKQKVPGDIAPRVSSFH